MCVCVCVCKDKHTFTQTHTHTHRGDVVGLVGYPGKSKKGELSIFPSKIVLLSACLHMLPKLDGSLKEQVVCDCVCVCVCVCVCMCVGGWVFLLNPKG